MSDEMPSSQECKAEAVRLMRELDGRRLDARAAQISLLGAQVWATLATVPEPLEPIEHTAVLDSLQPQFTVPAFPVLICPHGYQAKIEVDEGAGDGQVNSLTYRWSDCEICP